MKNLIYISGPITDNKTGLPRDGWQEDFRAAEEKLRGMGFDVMTPIDISKRALLEWNTRRINEGYDIEPEAPRWFYIHLCMDKLARYCSRAAFSSSLGATGVFRGATERCSDPTKGSESPFATEGFGRRLLLGLYVIGDMADISMSYGTMCEINFAMAAGLPVWSQYYNGYQMTNMLMQKTDGPTIAEQSKKLKR